MKTLLVNTLKLAIISGLFLGLPAYSADNGRVDTTPAVDEWDDDMWSDWGAPAQTTKPPTDERKEEPTASTSDLGAPSATSSFGDSSMAVRFRLVRDSESSEPRGVRKYRPTYTRKRL